MRACARGIPTVVLINNGIVFDHKIIKKIVNSLTPTTIPPYPFLIISRVNSVASLLGRFFKW